MLCESEYLFEKRFKTEFAYFRGWGGPYVTGHIFCFCVSSIFLIDGSGNQIVPNKFVSKSPLLI